MLPETVPLGPGDPRRLGGYTLLGRLGEDGRGIAYLGRSRDGELVVARLLRGRRTAGPRARSRLAREAEAMQQITGAHTARLLAVRMIGDRLYLISEYAPGRSLQQVVTERGPLPEERLQRVALRTARSLATIHRAGVVHGDFRPENVLLAKGGAKVTGLGAASLLGGAAAADERAGTPAYLAPEQIVDEPVGPPADVFAWGATMVFAATGRPPFGAGPNTTVMRRVTSRRPDLGELRGPLRELVLACLDKNPAARPTAPQLVRALREGRPPKPKPRPERIPPYRWRMMVALAVVVAAGFTIGVLLPGG